VNRRTVLAAAELTTVTITLAASVPILAHAANYGHAWGNPALAGAIVALALLVPITLVLLSVGMWEWRARAAVRRERADMPPSARTPLWSARDTVFEDYAVEYMSAPDASGRHSAPRPAPVSEQVRSAR
jgi:hypothetical protein